MTGEAIFWMILSMVIIWGGMGASIFHAAKKSKSK
ncbi:MAG TPA: MetS family NSS transporter small subunit [Bacillus sp. (in: firmicutes)]|nr:MetS family NSS transporter small subunit [Bacillus litorisediminis]HWO77165.1 MetS family NSS transporter small subunit [Bacillus sp. (in: firmicutes)]